MASTIQVDVIKDIGGNTIISSNGSGTFTSNLPASGGITNAQSFQLTADTAITGNGYFSSNWAVNSGGGGSVSTYSNLGTLVSQSSGTFSMSSTGYYFITYTVNSNFTVVNSQDSGTWDIIGTSNNFTNMGSISQGWESYDYVEHRTNCTTLTVLFNCNDTSNDKVRFGYGEGNGHDGITVYGDATTPRTTATFIRLGDSV